MEYIARVVFSRNGLQIRESHFVNKSSALIAVRQNGLALKYVSGRLQSDVDVAMVAVQQNGLALAWVRWFRGLKPTRVIEAAIRQNPAAAALGDVCEEFPT